MTKSTITRERLEQLANFKGAPVTRQEEQELARIALAAMGGEPACYISERNLATLTKYRAAVKVKAEPVMVRPVALYRHAQPAPERDQVRSEHAEWSQATFGNVGPVGPLKHLSKEALEAAAEPGDLSEWADMQFLLWDAQRRAGITDEQITQAMIEKLAVNKQREWPEPKDGEPRLHIKAQPAPVVQCPYPCGWDNLNKLAIQDAALVARGLVEGEPTTEAQRQAAISNNDRLLKVISACRAAMLQAEPVTTANKLGNSPAIPDGYVMVLKEPTEDMIIAGFESEPNEFFSESEVWEAFQKMSGCEQAAFRARLCWIAMLVAAPELVDNKPGWLREAEKQAELYGTSFVMFRSDSQPQICDHSKITISFTDEEAAAQAHEG